MRNGAEVYAVMSPAAQKLLRPDLLEWATGNPVITSLSGKTEHVRLAGQWIGKADLILIAPCTANTVSKIALGIDDTAVTTFASMALGNEIPLIIAPAAHEPMYNNRSVVENMAKLVSLGVEVVKPRVEEGKAKMADSDSIVSAVERTIAPKTLSGKNVLVTSGPTVEFIDPIRVISNLSSGKMGLSLARAAWRRGANVFYIYGGNLTPPPFIGSTRVLTTSEMANAVDKELDTRAYDIFISAAAPADFRPKRRNNKKIPTRRGSVVLKLVPTEKVLERVTSRSPRPFVVAFKAETTESLNELAKGSRRFLSHSSVDMVVANRVGADGPFGSETDEFLVVKGRRIVHLEKDTKENLAYKILNEIQKFIRRN
jgi:phosphopantothenoylcysteine decarboxylase/phosphopantothenate--cysteine ligase